MPSRIDRSVWVNKFSGSNGTQIMTAIKFFDLIDNEGIPNNDFKNLVSRDLELQKKIFRKLLYKYYEPIFDLDLTKATRYQFREAFKSFDTKEGVLIKCEAFFIQASKYSNIVLSTHILARRHNVNNSTSYEKNKQKLSKNKVSEPIDLKVSLHKNINVVKIILDKYPDFDPNWLPDVQKAWIDSLTKLYESLNKS